MGRETLFLDEDSPPVQDGQLTVDIATHMSCEECCAMVPGDEAVMEEATDYVLHYCGIDCYDTWHRRCGEGLLLDHRLE